MSATQFRAQLSMWAMLAAPLMVSDDLRRIRRASLLAVLNSDVLAIDQDAADVQGRLVSVSGDGEVWGRPLAGGARAVALLNRGARPALIRTSASQVGLQPAARYTVRNLRSPSASTTAGQIAARMPAFATVMLRIAGRQGRGSRARRLVALARSGGATSAG